MKKPLTFLIAICFAVTDTISVFVFFYSNMNKPTALLTLLFLMVDVFYKQYQLFETFINQASFNAFRLMPTPVWVINATFIITAGMFVFLQLSAQLFSIIIFLQSQCLSMHVSAVIPLIMVISTLSNLIKFRSDVMASWGVCTEYVHTWAALFSEKKLFASYFLLRIMTAMVCLSLSYYSYLLAHNSILYLLAHSQLYGLVSVILSHPMMMTLFVSAPLILLSLKTFVQCLLRIDRAIFYKLQNGQFPRIDISPQRAIKMIFNAGIKTIAAARISSLANSYVFVTSMMSELDDVKLDEDHDVQKNS